VAIAAVFAVLWMFVAAHATFFSPAVPMNPKDEGYITAFAVRMLRGHFLPYVDAVSHRGPMLYVVAALAVAAGGHASFVPVRVLALGCSMLVVWLAFVAAWRARRPLAGALAGIGIVVPLVLEMIPDDGLAFNGEPLLDVFALGALVCLAFGLAADRASPSARWTAAAGVLSALGALSKQVGVVTVASLALWPLAASIARASGGSRLRRWSPLWAFAAGAAAPPLLVVARYAAAGQLRTLYFYAVTYNARIYMAPVQGHEMLHRYRVWMSDHATLVAAGVALVAVAFARAFATLREDGLWRCVDRHGFLLTVALSALLTGAASDATARGFPHYFVQTIPWFALLAGLVLEDGLLAPEASSRRRLAVHLVVLVPTLAVVVALFLPHLDDMRLESRDHPTTLPICRYVWDHTPKDAPIYVWGFAADIYTYCNRPPASRFVYSTFQSGYVPFFDGATPAEERARVVPGSADQFLGDLEQSRAALVIDVPVTMGHRKIDDTPAYAAYLAARYCPPVVYDGVRVFGRRAPDGTCPARLH
jgi:4-amino-4-deoxy-L-arabinose transferase-like glycosyltransferase